MSYMKGRFKFRCDRGESHRTSNGPRQREYLKEMLKRDLNLPNVRVSQRSERSFQSFKTSEKQMSNPNLSVTPRFRQPCKLIFRSHLLDFRIVWEAL